MQIQPLRLLAVAFVATVFAGRATAATCTARDHMAQQLEAKFGETPYSRAPGKSNAVIEVFVALDASTWSITVFLPKRGLSCLAATGNGKRALTKALSMS